LASLLGSNPASHRTHSVHVGVLLAAEKEPSKHWWHSRFDVAVGGATTNVPIKQSVIGQHSVSDVSVAAAHIYWSLVQLLIVQQPRLLVGVDSSHSYWSCGHESTSLQADAGTSSSM
jgi:hypothetical protein